MAMVTRSFVIITENPNQNSQSLCAKTTKQEDDFSLTFLGVKYPSMTVLVAR